MDNYAASHCKNADLYARLSALATENGMTLVHRATSINGRDGYHRYLLCDQAVPPQLRDARHARVRAEARYSKWRLPSVIGERRALLELQELLGGGDDPAGGGDDPAGGGDDPAGGGDDPRRQWRRKNLAEINSARDYAAEQEALDGHPGVNIRSDGMPGDNGRIWRLHRHNMTNEDILDYAFICKKFRLSFERGVRAYYVTRDRLQAVYNALTAAGFATALDLDACAALRRDTAPGEGDGGCGGD